MIELDELGELAWVPLALLAAVLAWRSRTALLTGWSGGAALLPWRDGAAGLPGGWVASRAAMAFGWMRGAGAAGNQSFEQHRSEARRRLDDEQREFRAFAARLRQARDQAEFDAFTAERAK